MRPAPRRMSSFSPILAVLVLLLLLAHTVQAQDAVGLRGFVTNAETGTGLVDANVVLATLDGSLVTAASTGEDGFYRLDDVGRGTYLFRVSFVGYQTYTDTVRLETSESYVTKSVQIEPSAQELDEITVEAEGGSAKLEAGKQRVRVADIERIPTPSPTGDIASYLQSIPGVVSVGDRGGQLFVRGGTPSQNLVLMDGTLVYNPFHLIGFYSIFSEDMVSSADFYAGGFGAEYSDRISSVLDVTMRPGNKKKFGAAASASPFLVELRAEGPLVEDSFSFLVSARQSVVEETAPQYLSTDVPLKFNDFYLKLHDSGERSQCGVSLLSSYDRGRIDPRSADTFEAENRVLAGRCVLLVPENSSLFEVTSGVSRYENSTGSGAIRDRSAEIFRFHTDLSATLPIGNTEWNWGLAAKVNQYSYDVGETFGVFDVEEDELFTFSGFSSVTFSPVSTIDLTPGVAIVWPTTYPMSIEPRLRGQARFFGENGPTINFATGLYQQTFEGISDERDAGSVFTAWVPAPIDDKRAQSIHALLGVSDQVLPGVNISVEGYHRWISNLPVPKWSTLSRFTTVTTLAEGRSFGVDVRTTYERGDFYGFLGYGFGVVEYEAQQGDFGDWFGGGFQEYNPPHDQRHRVNATVEYDFGLAKANIGWQFSSGLPYTQVYGFDSFIDQRGLEQNPSEDFGSPRFIFDRPYDARLPVYHRLDVSVSRTFTLGSADFDLQGGAINIYDRSNIFYFDLAELRRVNQLPVVPYVGLKVEL